MCRFHRGWAEEMLPEIVDTLFQRKNQFLETISITASRINSRNASIFWESERTADLLHAFLRRKREVEGESQPELIEWLDKFQKNKGEAALEFWYEIHKGIHESLREF
jgi:glyceraldehyde-3-phosphate dehydrogenase (ferredoxin)